MAARAIPQGFPSRMGMRTEQAQLADRIHHGNLHGLRLAPPKTGGRVMSSSAARTAAMPGGHEPWSALLAGDARSPRTVRWRRQGETVEILDPLDADAGYEPAHRPLDHDITSYGRRARDGP